MKMKWPALGLASLVVASGTFLATVSQAGPGANLPTVRVNAQVVPGAVRIDARATSAFTYTASRPSESLLVVDLPGVSPAEAQHAQILGSGGIASYRLVSYGSGETAGVRLEILLDAPAHPRFERPNPQQLSVIFDSQSAFVHTSDRSPAVLHSSTSRISHVEVTDLENEPLLKVAGAGPLHYHTTRLYNPDRLVLDFADTMLGTTTASVPNGADPIRSVHVGQFQPDVARIVVDLDRWTRFTILDSKDGVTVAFSGSLGSGNVQSAAHRVQAEPKPATAAAKITGPVANAPADSAIRASNVSLPGFLTQPSSLLASPATPVPVPQQNTPQPQQTAMAAAMPASPPSAAAPRYSGEPINVNFKDVDLKDFFRLIHEISGLNVVLDPSVKGNLTLVLDQVPWDQALDIVLKNNNLDKQVDGNVLRIASQDTIKGEAQSRADLQKAEANAVATVTVTYTLSYAKVGPPQAGAGGGGAAASKSIEQVLKPFLTNRGDIVSDARTNTLIIRDIPSVIPTIDNLIHQLDKKSPQVEIEARIVAASRTFAQDIGTQFGVSGIQSSGGQQNIFAGAPIVGTSPISYPTGTVLPYSVSGTTSNPLATSFPATGPTSGFSFAHLSGNFALDFILTAAESKGAGKVLSRPKIMTQNNIKGTIKQGEEIPIQTTINNTISVQYIDAVLELDVTPQITADGTISILVHLENTQIDTGIPYIQGTPALQTQSVDNQVIVRDGGTVMLGGVMISSQSTQTNEVPLLGSLPIIGNLFKERAVKVNSSELLFFLTPRVVED
jgi:type IV pilus assembly protein PilQ